MAFKVEWDTVGERVYKAGIDRGVLYRDAVVSEGLPWNGLVSVEDNTSYELKSYYMEGIRYLNHVVPGNFEGRLTAITYPLEFDRLIMGAQFSGEALAMGSESGIGYYNQEHAKPFNLSYRRKIMSDSDEELGYEIHLLYNLTATPEPQIAETLTEDGAVTLFSWSLSGTPEISEETKTGRGVRPTSHVSIDSRTCDPAVLTTIENSLYGIAGTPGTSPNLLTLTEIRILFDDLD